MISHVNFYMSPNRIAQMRDGTGHVFFSRAQTAFERLGLTVGYIEDTDTNRQASVFEDAYAMFYRKVATHDLALDVRRTAIGPFFRMEQAADRAHYRLVDVAYDPQSVDRQKAQSFFKIWQNLLVKGPIAAGDAVLVALQGRLLHRRSQQAMSPIEMIKTTIAHDPVRPIWLKLHPKETYSAAELSALHKLTDARVCIFEGDLETALQNCAYIVTQNSAVLLQGLFYERPAVIFGDCEYHHPFQNVRRGVSIEQAFARVLSHPPDFARYAYWYLQLNCINTSREWAEDMIVAQCRAFGWEI